MASLPLQSSQIPSQHAALHAAINRCDFSAQRHLLVGVGALRSIDTCSTYSIHVGLYTCGRAIEWALGLSSLRRVCHADVAASLSRAVSVFFFSHLKFDRLVCRHYLGRLNLYRQRIWTCTVTGSHGLTYEEALTSEFASGEVSAPEEVCSTSNFDLMSSINVVLASVQSCT